MALVVASLVVVVQRSGRPPASRRGGSQRVAGTRRARRLPALPRIGRCQSAAGNRPVLPAVDRTRHSLCAARARQGDDTTARQPYRSFCHPCPRGRSWGRAGVWFGRSRRSSGGGAPGPDRSSGTDRVRTCGHRAPPGQDAQADHAALYSDPAWQQRLNWMLRGAVVDLSDFPATGQIHVPPHAATYSYPSAGMPIHVIRVLDPSLIPLTFGYDSDPDGRAELTDLWQRSGRSTSGPLEPHPLG